MNNYLAQFVVLMFLVMAAKAADVAAIEPDVSPQGIKAVVGTHNQADRLSAHGDYPRWFKAANYDLENLLKSSLDMGKQGLMVVFSMPDCRYCEQFSGETLRNPEIGEKVQENFLSVHLDISDNRSIVTPDGRALTIREFAKNERVFGTPAVYFYGDQGDRLARKMGSLPEQRFAHVIDFVTQRHYQTSSMSGYLIKKEMALITTDLAKDEADLAAIPYVPDPCSGCGDAADYY